MTITKERLAEIKARCEAATRAPWDVVEIHPKHYHVSAALDEPPVAEVEYIIQDAEFVAHARSDVPALLAEVERLRGLIKAAELTSRPDPVRGVAFGCPWCGLRCGRDRMIHASDCPAFTPEGKVK